MPKTTSKKTSHDFKDCFGFPVNCNLCIEITYQNHFGLPQWWSLFTCLAVISTILWITQNSNDNILLMLPWKFNGFDSLCIYSNCNINICKQGLFKISWRNVCIRWKIYAAFLANYGCHWLSVCYTFYIWLIWRNLISYISYFYRHWM